ncbi:helix-turn-helix transcriptional regulator [Phaeobacter marinintestinus]|uniref:helix-turn-helix transcriptional regulator n=1 Tax=Falsiphaeobacter marinintestinus TaxID=1492905 RepID=UPI0011B70146|nr:YafY family protein [Phaeobacter marinintestinus]
MRRSTRLFEIIQILRAAEAPMTATQIAERLEVSKRTVYRDIAALQAMRTPIEGEAGLGYVMRRGYDLPPLNFDSEEVEALRVGLAMLARTGDSALQQAALRICHKVEALHGPADWLQISTQGAAPDDPARGCVSVSVLRSAIRDERKLRLIYRDEDGSETDRVIRPLGLVYHVDCILLGAWCELRGGFRHFRTDRIWACDPQEAFFEGQAAGLRQLLRETDVPQIETITF